MSFHNRSLLNLAGSIGSGDYTFMDFMKGLKSLSAGTSAYPGSLTSTGYPDGTLSAAIQGITQVPTSSTSTEDWVVDWTGQISSGANTGVRLDPNVAGLTVTSGGAFVNGSTAFTLGLKGTNGRVQFNCNAHSVSQFTVNFQTTGSFSGFTSLRLYRAQDEAALNAGSIFYPPHLAALATLKPGILRFLDQAGINGNNHTAYAQLPSSNHLGYGFSRWDPTLWVGTIGGTDTYTCSAPSGWGGLVDGAVIQGQVTNANTSTTPNLDVGSSGVKTIYRFGGQGALGNTGVAAGVIAANGLHTFVYNATLDKWVYGGVGLAACMPLPVQVALCNQTGSDFWFQIPAFWSVTQVALAITYIRDNLDSSLTCYVEFSNEIWNATFSQTNFAYVMGLSILGAVGSTRQVYGWYALRVRLVMEAATTAWSPRSASQIKRVMAFQFFGSTSNIENHRFNGSDLGSFGYNVAPNRPIDYCDVVSFAPYASGAQIVNFDANYANTMTDALNAADDYASGDTTRMSSALSWLDNDIRQGTRNSSLGDNTLKNFNDSIYPPLAAMLAPYGKQVVCYEMAMECKSPTTATLSGLGIETGYAAKISGMLAAYKNDDRFRLLILDMYQDLLDACGSDSIPSWYGLLNETSPVWQWALYPSNLDSTPFKSFDAIVEWNSARAIAGALVPDPFSADDLANLRHHQDELKKATQRRSKNKREHQAKLRDAVEEIYDKLSGIAPAAAAKVAAVIPAKAKVTETAARSDTETPAIDWSKVTAAQIAKVIATMDAYAAQLDAEQRQQAVARADAARQKDEDDVESLLMSAP